MRCSAGSRTYWAEHAVTLMEHLPPVGWADVATKHDLLVLKGDLDALEERLNLRIDGLRQEFRSEIASVRQEMRAETSGIKRDLAALGDGLRSEMGAMKQEIIALLRAELSSALTAQTSALTAQTKTLMFTVLGALTSMTALTLGAGRV